MSHYPLGTNTSELERLEFQQTVWGGVTAAFLDRLGVAPGWAVADLGCGPGFLLDDWLARVGPRGRVLLVDQAARWQEPLEARAAAHANVSVHHASVQDVELEPGSLDLIFMRWVLSFVPDPEAVLRRLAQALKPGGLLAVQDYNHEGVSLFPESAGFRAVIEATREMYAAGGGDTWIAGRLPALFRAAGLAMVTLQPNVIAGGPDSPAFRWANLFFLPHTAHMVDEGFLRAEDRARFVDEWEARRADPDTLFFSPIVVDAAARRL